MITSSGLLQRDLPDARVVKVFNNIFFKHLARWPARTAPPTAPPCPSRATTSRPRRR